MYGPPPQYQYQQPAYPLGFNPYYPGSDAPSLGYGGYAFPPSQFQPQPQQLQQQQQAPQRPPSTQTSIIDRATSVTLKEKPKAKAGPCELLMSGMPQRAYVEAQQTVFKGSAWVYLADTAGEPLRTEVMAEFLLGGVGHLQVTVSDRRLGLQDDEVAAMIQLASAQEALEWAAFLTSSPLSQKPIVRTPRPPSMGQSRSRVNQPPRKGLGSRGQTPAHSHSLSEGAVEGQGRGEDEGRSSGASLQSLPHTASTTSVDKSPPQQQQQKQQQQQEEADKAKEEHRKEQEAYAALNAKITEIEGRIRHNAEHYASVLWDKEKNVVSECRVFRAKERKRVKAGYDRLQERLLARMVLPSERAGEEDKLNEWLAEQLRGIDRLASRREERAEAEYSRFREIEYALMLKGNNKLDGALRVAVRKRDRLAARLGIFSAVPHLNKISAEFAANEEARQFDRHPYLVTYLQDALDTRDIKLSLPEGCLDVGEGRDVKGAVRGEMGGMRVLVQGGDRVLLGGCDAAAGAARAQAVAWAAAAFPASSTELAAMIASASAAAGVGSAAAAGAGAGETGHNPAPARPEGESRNLASPSLFVLDRPFLTPHPAGTLVRLYRNKSNPPAPHLDPLLLLGLQQSSLTKRQRAILARMRYLMTKGHHSQADMENTGFCARIIQKAFRDYLQRCLAWEAMAPVRAAKARALQLIVWVQAVVRGRRGRREAVALMTRRLRLAENMARFHLHMHLLMYIARWRRKKAVRERDCAACLAACLERRQALVARRRVEAIEGQRAYGVVRPGPRVVGRAVGRGGGGGGEAGGALFAASASSSSPLSLSTLANNPGATQPPHDPPTHHANPHPSLLPYTAEHDVVVPAGITHTLARQALEEIDERRRHGGLVKSIKRRLGGGAGGLARTVRRLLQVHGEGDDDGQGVGGGGAHVRALLHKELGRDVGAAGLTGGAGAGAGVGVGVGGGLGGEGDGLASGAADVAAEVLRRRAVAHFVALKEAERRTLLARAEQQP